MRYHVFILFSIFLACVMFSGCKKEEVYPESRPGNNTYEEVTPDDDYEYELPVIFHVLYEDATDTLQYITASRLEEILEHVNELYVGDIYGESEDIKVKFVLAETNEDGDALSTPGVEYKKYHGDYPIDPYDFMNDDSGHSGNWRYIWEPNDYINVMVYNFSRDSDDDGVTLGISHLPYYANSTLPEIEGLTKNDKTYLSKDNLNFPYCVSINSLYAAKHYDDRYSNVEKQNYYSTDVIATLAHELGHYLGLYHVFTEVDDDEDACEDTDYCDDTPSYNKYKYDEWAKAFINATPNGQLTLADLAQREPCDGESYLATNIMDYAYCYSYTFTEDQTYRMRQVLYYSPLIPGPKKEYPTIITRSVDGIVALPIRTAK